MGYIRGKHTSPGVYSKVISVNNANASLYQRQKPLSSLNTNIPAVGGCFVFVTKDYLGFIVTKCENAAIFYDDVFQVEENKGDFFGDTLKLY